MAPKPAPKKAIFTPKAPKPVGPYSYTAQIGATVFVSGVLGLKKDMLRLVEEGAKPTSSQAVQIGDTVFVSGVLGLNKDTLKLVEGGAKPEAEQALLNLGHILDAADSYFANVVKTTVFLADMDDFPIVNEVYKKYFEEPYPARSCFQVAKLPLGAKVEIEAIAVSGNVRDVKPGLSQ